ncbi:MAG TPA: tetratricopeptide repeat protein [Terriglobales bacterium]|nr:tetratricopeptide repeat protein [Terriglobales bacterium]
MSSSPSPAAAKRLEQPGVSIFSTLFHLPQKRTLLLCLLLTAVVLGSYSPVAHNGFLNYDDDTYITNNPHVRAGLTWATVKWAFTTYDQANWHPLTWLSHALDCQLFGLHPAGPHFVNVLLHAANAVLLFLLLQSATGFRWRSLTVAALFALHPMNVESVAWAAERKNVLSVLFFLLALYAYVWYARKPALQRYALVAFSFALSLLCKPQAITFPFLLGLWDYWPLCRIGVPAVVGAARGDKVTKRSSGWLVLEKLPLLLLSAASAVITMKAQNAGGAIKTFSQYSPLSRLEVAVISYVSYMGKALWPSKLVALYPHPTKLYPVWQVGASVLLLLLVTALVLRGRDRRYLAVGWFWFLGTLVPMIGLVQVGAQGMADRYAYIPFVGLFLMVTWLAADSAKAYQLRAAWLAIAAVCWLLALGTLTYRQVGYWHDIPSFWSRTLALTEDNYIAHDTWGEYLARQGRTEEAVVHFRAALAIRPDDLPANLNLGTYEHGRGNLAAAIERYRMVAQHAADVSLRATAYGNLGSAYRQMGELMKAKQCFDMALQLAPDRPMAMIGLGLIAERNGDPSEAVRQYSRAMALQPTDVGFLLLAHALQQEGRPDEANAILERVGRSSPNLAEAQATAESLLSGK